MSDGKFARGFPSPTMRCRFSPHGEVALHRMSLPGGQSSIPYSYPPGHLQWDGLHVYLNMIRVVNN